MPEEQLLISKAGPEKNGKEEEQDHRISVLNVDGQSFLRHREGGKIRVLWENSQKYCNGGVSSRLMYKGLDYVRKVVGKIICYYSHQTQVLVHDTQ